MFKVTVLDIQRVSVIFQEKASNVILPGEEGELSVLDFHQSIISCLKHGMIKIDNTPVAIKSGIARMQGEELVVFVER